MNSTLKTICLSCKQYFEPYNEEILFCQLCDKDLNLIEKTTAMSSFIIYNTKRCYICNEKMIDIRVCKNHSKSLINKVIDIMWDQMENILNLTNKYKNN